MKLYELPRVKFRTETEIMSSWNKDLDYLVTIYCPIYNHEEFILDCLNGFLRQKTIYPFKILLRDDCSTDSTQEIIDNIAEFYPNIISVHKEPVNTFQEDKLSIMKFCTHNITTPFIAICEGDDFWVSDHKIQNQLDVLLTYYDQDIVACVAGTHLIELRQDENYYLSNTFGVGQNSIIGQEENIKSYFHTSSFMGRTDIMIKVVEEFLKHNLYGDTSMRIMFGKYGNMIALGEVMSIYRDSRKGTWTTLSREDKQRQNNEMYNKLAACFEGDLKKSLLELARQALHW